VERVSRGENDEDQVASIIVHISRQTEPRWKSEGWSEDGDTPKLA
jgi:hypothetical protein